ncbi:MAG: hypothetical protein E6R03_08930 [Hyphomicrobiaceae bacterium]|nr:MAG: hypothetical protein E6R03_08930 [Hyphomicrobiaceae bacterium]
MSDKVEVISNQWGGDGHSTGYLTRAQLKQKLIELKPKATEELLKSDHTQINITRHQHARLIEIIENLEKLSPDVDDNDQRLIFWFDN